jgi:hypothetical protein
MIVEGSLFDTSERKENLQERIPAAKTLLSGIGYSSKYRTRRKKGLLNL